MGMMIMTIIVKMGPKVDSHEEDMILVMTIDRMIKITEVATIAGEATALATLAMKILTLTRKYTSLGLTEGQV